ncbi:MAG: glycosyl hydrolase, partial [Saprospiraceae bacterium]|nr:glycosyl hydrolase [Saprospiraceae bacterium]
MNYRLFLSFTILILPFFLSAQDDFESGRNYWINTKEKDFSKIQNTMNTWYANRDKERGSGYKQWKRYEYRMKDKLDQEGRIVNVAAWNFQAAKEYYSQKSSVVQTGDWSFVAPNSWSNGNSGYNPGNGRVNCVGFHPSDANTFYIGTPFGGIWKTSDQGNTWTPLHDGLPSLGVSGIAVHPTNPDTIFILTGDGDGNNTPGVGVLKTYDGGITWMETGLSWAIDQSERGYRLVMDPNDPDKMLAATTDGILLTTDGWNTWTQQATGTFRDIEFKPGASNIAYAEKSGDFYRTVDGGLNWTKVTNGVPTNANRLAIGVSPDDANVVYFVAGPSDGAGRFVGLYYSDDQGQSFTMLNDTPNILGYSSSGSDNSHQSWYDLAIAVHPTDADRLYTGGINVWKKINPLPLLNISQWVYGGTQYTHADIHALDYNPLNNYLYCGSDGGIFQSIDGGDSWTDISSGIANMQFYKISGTPQNASLLVGGAQDNGTNKWDGGNDVIHIYGADGMDNMISYNDSDTIYYSTQNGGLRRSTNGGNSASGIKPPGSSGSWVTPYIMDPTNSSIIYGGYSDVYKSTNAGSSWTNMGADGRTAMAIGTNDPTRLYAARNNTLRTSSNGGTSWDNITGSWT